MTDIVIILNALAFTCLLLYALMQRSARRRSEKQASELLLRCASYRQRANLYKALMDRHVAAKAAYMHEVQELERKYTHLCVRRHRCNTVPGYRRLSFPRYSRTTVN